MTLDAESRRLIEFNVRGFTAVELGALAKYQRRVADRYTAEMRELPGVARQLALAEFFESLHAAAVQSDGRTA